MNTPHTPESARINKLAMDLIGDLQMIPPEQAYERTKLALIEASQSPTLLAQRNELSEVLGIAIATLERLKNDHNLKSVDGTLSIARAALNHAKD